MTTAQWGLLIPSIIAILGAGAAWLRAQAAHNRIDNLPQGTPSKNPGSGP